MYRFIKQNAWAFFLGGYLSNLGLDFSNYEFWIGSFGTILLVEWKAH